MKIRILAIIMVAMLIVTVNTAAAGVSFDISVDESFHRAYRGEDVTEIATLVGAESSELSAEFNKGGLLYFAVAPDNSVRIRLSEYADNFSVEAGDISYLNGDNMQNFLDSLSEKTGSKATVVQNGDRKYATTCETVSGENGVYTVTQYITVCDGKTYYLSCYNEGSGTSAAVERIFKSLKLSNDTAPQSDAEWPFVAIGVGIAAFALIAAIMVIGLIRTIKFK